MQDPDPLTQMVFLVEEDGEDGPYSLEELLEWIEQGQVDERTLCRREDAEEIEILRDVLDWDQDAEFVNPRAPTNNLPQHVARRPQAPPPVATPDVSRARKPRPDAILYSGHPSIITHPWALLALLGGIAGAIVWRNEPSSWTSLGCFFAALLALAWLGCKRFQQDYIITPKRIEEVRGLIVRSSTEARIADIRSINVSCRGLWGLLGIGTVDFFTSGDTPEVSFRQVWGAQKVKSFVRRLQDRESGETSRQH
jgi:GYF domain 2